MQQALQKLAVDGKLGALPTSSQLFDLPSMIEVESSGASHGTGKAATLAAKLDESVAVCGKLEERLSLAGYQPSPEPATKQVAAALRASDLSSNRLPSALDEAAPMEPLKQRFHIYAPSNMRDYYRRPSFVSGGGGMLSTAHDYARFAQMLLNKGELDGQRILSRKTVEYMTRNHLPLEGNGSPRRADIDMVATDTGFCETAFDGIGFGLGVSVIQDPIKASLLCSKGEYGWGGWASTFLAIDPEEQMFVMSLAQLGPSDRYPTRRQLRCLLYQALE